MLKPEYTNRFSMTIGHESRDAIISFFSTVPALDDEGMPAGEKNDNIPVASIAMTKENLVALHELIGRMLAQYKDTGK